MRPTVKKAWARAIYYPTLAYNILLGRVFKVRNWWDPVTEQVILGAMPFRSDAQDLKELGVTGVVNTCEEYNGPVSEYQRLGIEQLHIPTTDFHHPREDHVQSGAEFIQKHVDAGGCCYIHCKAGRARSATIVLWWLVKFEGLTPAEAQEKMLSARPHVNPKIAQRPVIVDLYGQLERRSLATCLLDQGKSQFELGI